MDTYMSLAKNPRGVGGGGGGEICAKIKIWGIYIVLFSEYKILRDK
jgi:hypothetical protein